MPRPPRPQWLLPSLCTRRLTTPRTRSTTWTGTSGMSWMEETWRGLTGHQQVPQVQGGVSRSDWWCLHGNQPGTSPKMSPEPIIANKVEGYAAPIWSTSVSLPWRSRVSAVQCLVLPPGPAKFSASSVSDKRRDGKCNQDVYWYFPHSAGGQCNNIEIFLVFHGRGHVDSQCCRHSWRQECIDKVEDHAKGPKHGKLPVNCVYICLIFLALTQIIGWRQASGKRGQGMISFMFSIINTNL